MFESHEENPADIGPLWYRLAAVQLMANTFSNMLIPQIVSLIKPLKNKLMVRIFAKGAIIQEELNEIMEKPEFNVAQQMS